MQEAEAAQRFVQLLGGYAAVDQGAVERREAEFPALVGRVCVVDMRVGHGGREVAQVAHGAHERVLVPVEGKQAASAARPA